MSYLIIIRESSLLTKQDIFLIYNMFIHSLPDVISISNCVCAIVRLNDDGSAKKDPTFSIVSVLKSHDRVIAITPSRNYYRAIALLCSSIIIITLSRHRHRAIAKLLHCHHSINSLSLQNRINALSTQISIVR